MAHDVVGRCRRASVLRRPGSRRCRSHSDHGAVAIDQAIQRTGAKTQGHGHETTWAQIVDHELSIPGEDIVVEEGDPDTAPFGMSTYASREAHQLMADVAARRW